MLQGSEGLQYRHILQCSKSKNKSEDSLVQPLQESMFYVAGKWGTTVSTHPTMLQEQVIKSEDSLVQPLQESMFYVAGKWGTTVSTHPTMLQEQVIKSEDSLVQPLQESMFYVAGKWGTTVSTHPTMLQEQVIKVKIPWYSHYRNLCSMLQGSEGLQYRHILQCSKSK